MSLYGYETGEFEADIVKNEDLHYWNIWTTITLSDNIILDEQCFENCEGDETHEYSCKKNIETIFCYYNIDYGES